VLHQKAPSLLCWMSDPTRFDVHALPAQLLAAAAANVGQTGTFHHGYAFTFTASSSARFTATFTSCTL